ncbi:MAG: tetratricopeptide repeat protein [Aquincola sp.]|nr:tetratricopeptide repeat protein [Aquincola sp.]MDH4287777.1 tetratricopeptide repeat protein [Aquincola sp.]MDH5328429.1 tetratricopeptide repeat protein [Aquincola sp.]
MDSKPVMNYIFRHRFAWAAAWVGVALILGACATADPPAAPPRPPAGLFEDAAFGAPSLRPDPDAVFALSPAMERYLAQDISSLIRQLGPQRALVDALHSKAQLRLEYDSELTRTAAQAFDARAGNCLSLVVMTAALAKRLELPIAYQALVGHETWSRSGDLSFVNGHVNITVAKRLVDRIAAFDADTQLRIEFGTIPVGRAQLLRVVSEATIVSMFMNNRAAEYLVRGDFDNAYAHAREAVLQDPRHPGAYNTLGVIYQRRGMDPAAERAYRAALDLDGDHVPTLMNLSRMLERQGRAADAAPLLARVAQLERNPPFAHFDRGVAAAKAGDFRTARDEIEIEMRRDPDYHEFHFWLAVALYGLGDTAQARIHLTEAMKNSLTRREQAIYAGKLRSLEPAVSAATPGRAVN